MIAIDYKSRTPIYEQLVSRIRGLAVEGVYAPGERLPSVRQLSADLGLNPNTVQRAYNTLVHEGVAEALPGKGIFISHDLGALRAACRGELFEELGRAVRALKKAGAQREEVLDCAAASYDGEGSEDD